MAEQHSTQEGQQQSLLAYHSSPPSRKRKQEFQYPHIFDQHHHHQQQQRQQQQPQPTYSQSSSSWTYLQQQQSSDSSVAVDTLSSRLDEHQQPQGLGNWHVLTPSFHQQQHDPSRRSSSPFSGSNQFSRPVDQVPSSTSSSNTETTLRSQTNLDFFPPDDISGERRDTIFKQEDIDLSFGLPTLPHDTTGSGAVYHHEPSSYADRSTARQLRLTDIDSIHERGQQQLIQSWVGGRSANATPTTPAFFSPGFLDSLQQDDEPQALAQSTPYALQHVDWQQQQEQQQQQQQQQEQHDQGVSAAFHEFSSFAAVDAMVCHHAVILYSRRIPSSSLTILQRVFLAQGQPQPTATRMLRDIINQLDIRYLLQSHRLRLRPQLLAAPRLCTADSQTCRFVVATCLVTSLLAPICHQPSQKATKT